MINSPKEKLRGLAKSSCAKGLEWSRLAGYVGARRGLENFPLVIGYHRVVEDFQRSTRTSISPMLVSAAVFEKHLDWIGSRYRFVSLDELAMTLKGNGARREPVAAITFDDGYKDVYENAFPILKRKGIPFAVFVVTNLINTSRLQAHDEIFLLLSAFVTQSKTAGCDWQEAVKCLDLSATRSEHLLSTLDGTVDPYLATREILDVLRHANAQNFIQELRKRVKRVPTGLQELHSLSWDMLREMVANGATVGSHTKSHVHLPHESLKVVRDEVEGSRQDLQSALGIPVKHFAYPDGRFDSRIIDALVIAGYHTAYTTCLHRDAAYPHLTIPRTMLWENSCTNSFREFSPAILNCLVNGIFNSANRCHLEHSVRSAP